MLPLTEQQKDKFILRVSERLNKGSQFKVALYLYSLSFAEGKRSTGAINISKICKALNFDERSTVDKALKDMVDEALLKRTNHGRYGVDFELLVEPSYSRPKKKPRKIKLRQT